MQDDSIGKLIAFFVTVIVLLYVNIHVYYPAILQLPFPLNLLLAVASPPIEVILLSKGMETLDSF